MGFTTQIFLFVFFPLCLIVYYLVDALSRKGVLASFFNKIRARDLTLIVFGFGFYMWACFDDGFRFALYIGAVYIAGRCIQRSRERNRQLVMTEGEGTATAGFPLARIGLWIAIVGVTACLIHFKYTSLLADVWNLLFRDTIQTNSIVAPLGVSFITFSAISYLADIYKGKAVAGSFIDCALYLTFFPKVVSGPIVLWRDFQPQIKARSLRLTLSTDGLNRIMIGFAKKLILADTFGACLASIPYNMDFPTAWGAALLYMLQIYYDFSGYSDIAIGLSALFGFELKENFNFPYLSKSISEFWRRWHISLGTWFREYIYFPLGGSRVTKARTLFNLGVVFVLTGIWHGAGWNYMLWGALNGFFAIIERPLSEKQWYQKIPGFLKWFGAMGITFFSWILFRYTSMWYVKNQVFTMFGLWRHTDSPYTWEYFFDARIVVLVIIGFLGATVWGLPKVQQFYRRVVDTKAGYGVQQVVFLLLFALAILFMVNSTYSPFIYFQY